MNPTDIPIDVLKEITKQIHSQELLLAYAILIISAVLCILGFYFGYKILSSFFDKRDDVIAKFKDDVVLALSNLTNVLGKVVTVQELDHDSTKTNRELIGDISECLVKIEIGVNSLSPTLQRHMETCQKQYERLKEGQL